MIDVRVQEADFDLGAEAARLRNLSPTMGALVTFSGLVRGGDVTQMALEHYPGMTEAALREIAQEAATRFALEACLIIHRHGVLQPGEQIMMVAAGARHRAAAFEGADFMMDFLKSRAPFWKKETHRSGDDAWVDARDSDEAALKRW